MQLTDYWQLRVAFWADARPEDYRAHTFDFQYPPTRADFRAACGYLPWTSVWADTLFPVIAANDWPLVAPGYKRASVSLADADGRIVGELEVSRQRFWRNPCAAIQDFSYWDTEAVVNRLPKYKRTDALRVIRQRANHIREVLSTPDNRLTAREVIRALLREAGILGARKGAQNV